MSYKTFVVAVCNKCGFRSDNLAPLWEIEELEVINNALVTHGWSSVKDKNGLVLHLCSCCSEQSRPIWWPNETEVSGS